LAQQTHRPQPAPLPPAIEEPAMQTVTGSVTKFTQSPTGETDGFEVDGGRTTVHFPPYLGNQVTAAVAKNNQVRVTGLAGAPVGTPPLILLEAQTITNLTTNRTLDVEKLLLQRTPTPAPIPPAGGARPTETPPGGPTPPIPGAR
jgi:hypothetical protein